MKNDVEFQEDIISSEDAVGNNDNEAVGAEMQGNEDVTTEIDYDKQIKDLQQQIASANDEKLRLQAEMQNTQKRQQDENKKTRDYAISSFAKDLVSVKDHLEMALQDQSGNFEMLKMGVELTLKQLTQAFETHKIKTVNPQSGDKLDPHLHQAIETVNDTNQQTNTIVAVKQKGYVLNERVLRPAMVSVAT